MLTDQWFVKMEALAQRGSAGGGRRRSQVLSRALDHDLQPLAGKHPGLVHLAPALVGPPDPGLVRRARQRLRRAQRRRGQTQAPPGLHGALRRDEDVLDTWFSSALVAVHRWAGRKTRPPRGFPALRGAGYRLRHHFLLGRAHDHDDPAFHRQGPVPPRLHQRPGARRARARKCPSPRAIPWIRSI